MNSFEASTTTIDDWRVRLGVGVTGLWLLLGIIYTSSIVGWGEFVRQQAPDLGEFLGGAFDLWLSCGLWSYFCEYRRWSANSPA